LSTSLKKLFGILIVGVALSLGILTALPVMAEAQDMDEASMGAEQNTVKNAGAVVTTQPTTEPPTAGRVVNPGDSLWSIGQEHLGPEATPERILEEARRIYEINQDRIGNDPNLLVAGQELLMPSVPESTTQPVAQEPVAQEPVAQEPAPAESAAPAESVDLPDSPEAQEDIPVAREVAAEEPSSFFAPLVNLDDQERRKVLGLGIILLTLVFAILIAWKLPMNRGGWRSAPSSGTYQDYFSNYALPTRESDPSESAPTGPGAASSKAAPQVQQLGTAKAPAGGEVAAGSDDLEQILTPLLTDMLKDMQQWREEHSAVPQGDASVEANASNGPHEAENSPSSVPAHERLRLVDAPPDQHEEEHQRSSRKEVSK
jgi:hypothetical protein